MDLLAVLEKAAYDYASTQLNLPPEQAKIVRAMVRNIDDADLIKREMVPHVTLKYGLHSNDSTPIANLLADEGPIRIKFGKTEYFTADESSNNKEVVYVKVFSPDLRRIHAKICKAVPHTSTYPKYEPHVTVAYVKPGKGKKYVGRTDLQGLELYIDTVMFSTKSGRKTPIKLKARKAAYDVPLSVAGGGIAGALGGRYVLAPALARVLGLHPDRARSSLTTLGALLGAIPGIQRGMVNQRLHGDFFAPSGPPRNALGAQRHALYALGGPVKSGSYGPRADTWNPALWKPTFPVAQSLDEISRSPHPGLFERVKMKQLIAQAGQEQGVGMTGMASPGALMAALPKVVGYAVPTAGGAYLAASALGAPRRVKNTAVGAALVYSVLKGFMGKQSAARPEVHTVSKLDRKLMDRPEPTGGYVGQPYASMAKTLKARTGDVSQRPVQYAGHAIKGGCANAAAERIKSQIGGTGTKAAKALPPGYTPSERRLDGAPRGLRRFIIAHKRDGDIGSVETVSAPGSSAAIVRKLQVRDGHRGRGLGRTLLMIAEQQNKGRTMQLKADSFGDRPLDGNALRKFYESAGYKDTNGKGDMQKDRNKGD